MKTKEEILEDNRKCYKHGWCITGDIHYTLDEAALNAMDIYAAQEVDRAKVETCKWKRTTPKLGCGWIAGCDKEDGVPFANILVMVYFKYCPLCGKKIERV